MRAWTRRRFVGATAAAGAGVVASSASSSTAPSNRPPGGGGVPGPLCLFSKLLPGLEVKDLARALQSMGFAGVDLTVRPGGHVAPERAATDLPLFVQGLREEGLAVPMITTSLTSGSEPTARPILETAGRLGVPFFKPGYHRYAFVDVRSELEAAATAVRGLAALGTRCGVAMGYHNHAGGYVGAPIWDIARIIDGLDSRFVGYYFDVRHAVVEGGDSGWRAALALVAPRLKMIAIKDFFWEKGPTGWRQRHCPLGEGMVNWRAFFVALARSTFSGPVSLHLEYEISGATRQAKQEMALAAAARDLAFLKARLAEAFGTPGAPAS